MTLVPSLSWKQVSCERSSEQSQLILVEGQAGGAFTDVNDHASSPLWSTPQGNGQRSL